MSVPTEGNLKRSQVLKVSDGAVVCNVKVAHIRPAFANLKEWEASESNVYIGRAGVVFISGERYPKRASQWANPFKVGKDGDLSSVLLQFEMHIRNKISNLNLSESLLALDGKNLGCWCVTKPSSYGDGVTEVCHGQVLCRIINEFKKNRSLAHQGLVETHL